MQSWAQEDSVYRRAQRFFAEIEFDGLLFTRLMVSLLAKTRYTLCLDRTNWQFGVFNINILMVAVADEGIAIPLAFVLLEKRGNSNTLERTQLLEQVLEVIKPEQTLGFTRRQRVYRTRLVHILERQEHSLRYPHKRKQPSGRVVSASGFFPAAQKGSEEVSLPPLQNLRLHPQCGGYQKCR